MPDADASEIAEIAPPAGPAEGWSVLRRFSFRFVFAYLVLYLFPFPLDSIPGMSWFSNGYQNLWNVIVPWVGKHVLHMSQDVTVFPNGSGDTTFNYVQVVCFFAFAAAATLVWSIADARRKSYACLHNWLRVYVRYGLASIMLTYGMAKVIKTQFPFPDAGRLLEPYGQSSPMGLLWTFMGYSTAYTFFAGAAEAAGGLLLFWRPTTTLGALVVAIVMINVVMVNFSYDVPVKLYSLHLLLMAVFLMLPDLKRLAGVLVLNRPTAPAALWRPFRSRWMNWAGVGLKIIFVGGIFGMTTWQSLESWKKYGDQAPKPPLYGIYEVETFVRNGETLPPLVTAANRWRKVVFDRYGGLWVVMMNDSVERFRATIDAAKKSLALTSRTDARQKTAVAYFQPEAAVLALDGKFFSDTISVRLRKVPEQAFPLVNRGFHWINEYPFNR